MAFYIVVTIILTLLVTLLLLPIIFYINTTSNQYYIQLQGVFKANLEAHDTEIFRIRLNLFFMKFYIYPLKMRYKKPKEKVKKEHIPKSKSYSLTKIFRVVRTFKVEQFFMNIDTGNYVFNAKLFPLITLLNYKTEHFKVNFLGQNELVLLVRNRPINIIKAFINF